MRFLSLRTDFILHVLIIEWSEYFWKFPRLMREIGQTINLDGKHFVSLSLPLTQ